MSLALDRPEFAPPPQRGTPRAVVLALIAHALLILALTWGLRWKSEADDDAVEAELWSSTTQVAAPRNAPEPTPAPAPTPAPPPPAPVPPPPAPVAVPKTPDIALEQEKKLKEQQQKEQEQRLQEKKRQEAAAQEKKDKELEAKKREEADRLKDQQKREELAKKAELQKAQLEKDRQDNLRRMMGQAGSTAERTIAPRSGKGAGSGGPSGGYYGRVAALIKRNIIFPSPDLLSGNPTVDIEIKTSPDGTIVDSRVVRSSGVPAWDEAALRAIQRTDVMPRDIDGRVPDPFPPIRMRPKDFQ